MKNPLKILFIEDTPDDIDLMLIEFQKHKLSVDWKRIDTKKELIKELDNKWDLIISDYVMPGFSGSEAVKTIRERLECLPVIVVSGTIGEDVAVETLKAGATDYLMKNNLTRLVPSIERAVSEYNIKLENKQAELALKEDQERIESIFRASPVGIGVLVNRVFTDVNDKLCQMTGYSENELINKGAIILYPNREEYEFVGKEKYKQLEEPGTGSVETHWKCKNGEIIDIILSSSAFDPKDLSKGVTFTALDITERNIARKTIEKSAKEWQTTFDSFKDVIFLIGREGIVVNSNSSAIHFFGISKQKLKAKYIWQLLYNVDKKPDNCIWDTVFESGKRESQEITLNNKLFEIIGDPILSLEGKIENVILIIYDITDRRKALEALEESETKFRLLADHTNDWEYWINPQGKYIYISPSCEKISGYPAEKFYTNPDFMIEIIHPDFRELSKAHFKHVNRQDEMLSSYEFCLIRADGEERWIEHICRPVFDSKGEFLGRRGTNRDITQRKLNEEKINTLAHAIRSISDLVSMTDVDNNILFVNNAFLNTYGFKEEDLIGKKMNLFASSKNTLELQNEILEKTIKGGWHGELWNKRKDGSEFQISLSTSLIKDDNGNTLALVGVANDITERKHAELLQKIIYDISQAANTAENLDELIDIIKDQVQLIIDVKNFYVAFYNKDDDTFTSPYMLDEKDNFVTWNAGKTFTNYVFKSEKSALLTKNEAKRLEEMGEVEFVGTIPEVWLGVPLKIKGETYGVFAVQNYENEDAYTEKDLEVLEFVSHQMSISIERKKAENELKVAYEKAMESDRLKSAFLATMSHELRTPLNAIIGFSALIRENIAMDKALNFAGIINRSGSHLLEIIEDIFDVTLLEVGQVNVVKETHSLATLMQSIQELALVEQLKLESKANLIYKPSADEEEILIYTDKAKFIQIILNLLKNALKFTREGFIEYGYEKIEEKGKPFLRFYVKDTGIGISKEKYEIIFSIFRQVDETMTRDYGGTGIGLFVVKKYTEFMGGRVNLVSEEGIGTTFFVILPYVVPENNEIDEKEKPEISSTTTFSDKTILIAEDDKVSSELLKELLIDLETNYLTVENGTDAVKVCIENPDIDLVLMDIKMPDMNGYEATKLIKEKRPELIIVAQTANAVIGDKEKALDAGCDDYISKPIMQYDLLRIMKTFLKT
ncbi:MAG: PAS domain S-box protein [Bacteroidales bacterium]|jgi:PAS domain S-box-containing protein|nr:PAS domain S-box protein [Bacteroidales bacterium]